MTQEKYQALRKAVRDTLSKMTSDLTERESVVSIAGHTCERRYVYAGGSQWCGCGRDWDTSESAWAWVIDETYILTHPSLFGFDGSNLIEQQTEYYLQAGYSATCPSGPEGDPLTRVPARILIEIGNALHCAAEAEARRRVQEDAEADRLIGGLAVGELVPA